MLRVAKQNKMLSKTVPWPRPALAWLAFGLPALGLLVIAALWAGIWLTLQADRERVRADAESRALSLAQAFESHTQRGLQQVDLVTRFLAYEYAQHGTPPDLSGVLRDSILRQPGVLAVTLFDAKGDRAVSTAAGPAYNIADREHFQVHQRQAGNQLHISHPVIGRGDQRWLVMMTRRLQDAQGRFGGIALVAVDPAYFTDFYVEGQLGRQGLVSLVGTDWVVRARRSGERVWHGQTSANLQLAQAIANTREGSLHTVSSVDGVPRIIAFRKLEDYPLLAVAGLSDAEVWAMHESWSRRLLQAGSLATVLLLLAFSALTVLTQRLHRRSLQLWRAKSKFEAASDAQLDAFLILRAVRDASGRIVDFRCEHCNDHAVRMLGIPRERLLAQTRAEVVGPGQDPRFFDLYCRVIATRQAEEAELLMGDPVPGRWVRHQVVPVDDGVAVTSRDVTALREHAQQIAQSQAALAASENRLRAVTESIPALVAYLDREERFRFANRHYQTYLGLDPERLVGQTLRAMRGEVAYAALAPHVQGALRGERQQFEVDDARSGRQVCYQCNYVPDRAADGSVAGFYALGFDVTALKEAERRQQRSEQRLRDITDSLPVLISYVDAELRIEFCNKTCLRWLGLDPARVGGKTLHEIWPTEVLQQRLPFLERALQGEHVEFEVERAALGVVRTLHNVYLPDVGAEGHVRGLYMLSLDVTALKQVERKLLTLARFDTLTGLANRLQFNEKLPEALSRAQRRGEAMALMFLDVDHFKAVNDAWGHAAGDAVLKEFAERLRRSVRATDTVARLAGDEFVVILENVHSEAEPQFVARKIVGQISRPFDIDGHRIDVTTSVGIAYHRGGAIAPEELLARADKALYAAKSAGRNTFHVSASV